MLEDESRSVLGMSSLEEQAPPTHSGQILSELGLLTEVTGLHNVWFWSGVSDGDHARLDETESVHSVTTGQLVTF